jgi:hypothetical protein
VVTENNTLKHMAVGSDDFDGAFRVQDMSAGEYQPLGGDYRSRTDLDSCPRFFGGDLQKNGSLAGLDDSTSNPALERFKVTLLSWKS